MTAMTETAAYSGKCQDRAAPDTPRVHKPPHAAESVTRAGEVRRAVGAVVDPELPVLTLAMLGMVHDVRVDGDRAEVELLPTFAGCPATEVIGQDAEAAALMVAGVQHVTIRFRFSPAWSAARITDEGHARLREFGIAPPTGGGPLSDVSPVGCRSLPVIAAPAAAARPCPYCGSTATDRESVFGPTPCRDVRYCHACRQPFEAFKDL